MAAAGRCWLLQRAPTCPHTSVCSSMTPWVQASRSTGRLQGPRGELIRSLREAGGQAVRSEAMDSVAAALVAGALQHSYGGPLACLIVPRCTRQQVQLAAGGTAPS